MMNITPILFGLLLGAALGVLVTGLRGTDLRKDSPFAFAGFRLRQFFDRNKCAAATRSWGTQVLWAAGRVLRVEWIILLTAVWLLVPLLWLTAYWWRFLGLDPDWLRNCFTGTLVGFIAAPWVWLHFSRDFISDDEKHREDSDKTRAEFLARYRFLTIVLGILLLYATVSPLIADLLPRANKFDLFGFSVSLPERGSGQTPSPVVNSGSSAIGGTAIGRLTNNTRQAWLISYGELPVDGIKFNLKNFESLSAWDRDSAFIAYFVHEEKRQNGQDLGKRFPDLREYIDSSTPANEGNKRDKLFIDGTRTFFGCLNTYASKVQDIHFYFLDAAPYLTELSLLVVRRPADGNAAAPVGATEFIKVAGAFLDSIRKFRARWGAGWERKKQPDSCKEYVPSLDKPDGSTPYPALVLAYSLAAVDAPEAGIYYLSAWIQWAEVQRAEEQRKPRGASFMLSWYLLRAKIDLAQMATNSMRSMITPERLVVFERQLTGEFASLLGVSTTKGWKKLCEPAGKNVLHAEIGRRLAFTYAVARNYLFELQTPGLIQSWRGGGQNALTDRLDDDLTEAVAFADSLDCYVGIPAFDEHKWQWIGQFQLNIAQLRLARIRPTLSDSEVQAERKEIEHLLNEAAAALGQAPPDASPLVADQLLGSDLFDDQRVRLQVLKSLAQIPPSR